jgi:hypothetical protein
MSNVFASSKSTFASAFFTALAATLALSGCVVGGDATGANGEPAAAETVGQQQEAWDSQDGNPTHATHSYLTEYAIDTLKAQYPELQTYRAQIVDGANRELHELAITSGSTTYGTLAEQEALRIEVAGTNWGCDHPEALWAHAKTAYAAGNKSKAYWYTGIVLHFVEDMGVPAHAFHVIHQGSLTQKDNFELLALQNWAPSFSAINRNNPQYAAPSDYVAFMGPWAANDFTTTWPGVTYSRTFFSSSWLWASTKEGNFVKARQGRTASAAMWALQSAAAHIKP